MILDALYEVLFWEDISVLEDFMRENIRKYYPHDPDAYIREKDRFLREKIVDRAMFLRRIQHYIRHGAPVWISGRSQTIDDVSCVDMEKAILYSATQENGRRLAAQAEAYFAKNSEFWEEYTHQVLHAPCQKILELTVGAGGGTTAVMRGMRTEDLYMGVDIDFVCAKQADALAKHYHVNGLGMASSLWRLPFDDGIFSVVCSNQGLEECREIPTILQEAARVLMPGGRMVLHCLQDGRSHWYDLFARYGFSVDETREWLRKTRLYSDVEQIEALAKECSLTRICKSTDDVKGYILVFEKN